MSQTDQERSEKINANTRRVPRRGLFCSCLLETRPMGRASPHHWSLGGEAYFPQCYLYQLFCAAVDRGAGYFAAAVFVFCLWNGQANMDANLMLHSKNSIKKKVNSSNTVTRGEGFFLNYHFMCTVYLIRFVRLSIFFILSVMLFF